MTGSASISGLASGLDTATIIEQFMQLEAVPQNRLKTRLSADQTAVTFLQTLNTKLSALATKAGDLTRPTAWSSVTSSSSEPKVTVTTASGASPGSFSLTVGQTALTHRSEHASAVGLDDAGTVPTSIRLDRLDGTAPVDLTTDGTLRGLVAAVNDPANATGLRATAVRVGPDSYRLLVESTDTGAATDFTLTAAADGSALLGGTTVRAGRDAQVTLGDTIVATSATNTFADLVPGVTVTLAPGTASGTTSEVTLARDPGALAASVKALVDAVNTALSDIDAQTRTDAGTKRTSLTSDSGLRSLRSQLQSTAFPGDGTSLSDLGIQTDRYGRLVFDETAFRAAYDADPALVQTRMTTSGTGFAARVAEVATAASNKADGTLTTSITGRNDAIKRLNDTITSWDLRLELRRTALTRQFTALETALSQMNSQSSWLAGQINSLSSGSGS